MTPPHATTQVQPLWSVRPARETRLRGRTPAGPLAVLLPPFALGALTACVVGFTQALLATRGWTWAVPSIAAGCGVAMLLTNYVTRALLRGTTLNDTRHWLAPSAAAVVGALLLLVLPAATFHAAAAVIALFLGAFATEVGPRWREHLMLDRAKRVSLMAPDELSAGEAIARLEALPAYEVVSVVIPHCDTALATRLLGRPTICALGPDTRLERHVIVSCPSRDPLVSSFMARLVAQGHRIRSESSALRHAEGRVDSTQANPLTLLMGMRHSCAVELVRRLGAFALAAAILVLLAPLFLAVAAAIVIESGFPVFYRQTRVGLRGRLFDVVKFRTMKRDAERGSGPVFASDRDPRVTAVGRFLRRYRLDELPQLWNVLKGDMAFVGPRPERPYFFSVLREDVPLFELRTCVRPGITGWAQVRLPYAADADEAQAKLEHDLYYVTRRSVFFDLAILFDTLGVALSGTGAR